jgi:triosephosphate isomerase
MRKKLVVGNWKMNKTAAEARALVRAIASGGGGSPGPLRGGVEVVICPPFVFLGMAVEMTRGTGVLVGAQNAHHEPAGPFTGEVSFRMLEDLGCAYVILGHSERRSFFHETDADVNRKVRRCLESGLKPILCVGETLAQRRAGSAFDVLNEQVVYGLEGVDDGLLGEVVIAYEPVWAIGTGVSASSAQAQEVHRFIRRVLGNFSSGATAGGARVIYGGSVTAENAATLMREPDIDGALVGGASLIPESFTGIIRGAEAAAVPR